MFRWLCILYCALFHVHHYTHKPEKDTATHKGVYCDKCQVDFQVKNGAYKRFEKFVKNA